MIEMLEPYTLVVDSGSGQHCIVQPHNLGRTSGLALKISLTLVLVYKKVKIEDQRHNWSTIFRAAITGLQSTPLIRSLNLLTVDNIPSSSLLEDRR